ncbi:MAG: Gfo/Idh/MocA family oxidoreductase, partial [Eudoraea sp.]|nr:Gfo/Idh/MocA family oxidoreductase [Eudoraea sp.]
MKNKYSRRDVLKGLAGLPFLGYFANRFYASQKESASLPEVDWSEFGISEYDPEIIQVAGNTVPGKKIRIGVVGYGGRGDYIFRALGYASDEWAKNYMNKGKPSSLLKNFLDQDDLNVEITGVCDTYGPRAERGATNAATTIRAGGAKPGKPAKIYPSYKDMLADDQLDAIMIQTPDHLHAKMAIDAANAGKHIYLEKPMCQTAEEAKELRDTIKKTGVVFQVGHQNRQQASYKKAKEIVGKGILGPVSLIETFTNRNTDHGAWIRGIPDDANETNVNWKEFLGDKPWREYDPDMYFNWQKWFEFGTGPAGNQFTHEFDGVNQVMDLGIPESVIATGGNYYFKDPRNIPDVFNVVFHYPQKGLSLTYDCTLRNSNQRPMTFMAEEGTMKVGVTLSVYPDSRSTKFKEFKDNTSAPIFAYNPKSLAVDAVASATSRSYFESGFGYTYNKGERIDCAYLHVKEWLNSIRTGAEPSCNIDRGFEETVTFYMANLAYLEKRVVKWDPVNEK